MTFFAIYFADDRMYIWVCIWIPEKGGQEEEEVISLLSERSGVHTLFSIYPKASLRAIKKPSSDNSFITPTTMKLTGFLPTLTCVRACVFLYACNKKPATLSHQRVTQPPETLSVRGEQERERGRSYFINNWKNPISLWSINPLTIVLLSVNFLRANNVLCSRICIELLLSAGWTDSWGLWWDKIGANAELWAWKKHMLWWEWTCASHHHDDYSGLKGDLLVWKKRIFQWGMHRMGLVMHRGGRKDGVVERCVGTCCTQIIGLSPFKPFTGIDSWKHTHGPIVSCRRVPAEQLLTYTTWPHQ